LVNNEKCNAMILLLNWDDITRLKIAFSIVLNNFLLDKLMVELMKSNQECSCFSITQKLTHDESNNWNPQTTLKNVICKPERL
jgi:hypothetical protein